MVTEDEKSKISMLTKSEIMEVLRSEGVQLTSWQQRDRLTLLHLLWEQPEPIIFALLSKVQSKIQAKNVAHEEKKAATLKRQSKQKRGHRQAKRQRLDGQPPDDSLEFLTLPSDSDTRRCHKSFLDATSNAALQMSTCVSCARELSDSAGTFKYLDSLENSHRLVPKHPHPAHTTINSMLLVVEKVTEMDGRAGGWFCYSCLRSLEANRLPPLALANQMWIGPIPPEISCLTIPEQILVSLYHPRAYIYKLYPRNLWGHGGDSSHLQTGLKGNVTTYELNIPDVVRMLEGKLMPRKTSVLASLIAVTFIGVGANRVPKSWLKQTFRVRRNAVRDALRCLKEVTRHPGYIDIEISEAELAKLPNDEVPDEILAAIRHEEDLEKAQNEAATYSMPDDITPGNLTGDAPDAISLQFLGAIDTDLSKVSQDEILLYGLANVDGSNNHEGGYAVRHSRNPVSEFSQPSRKAGEPTPPTLIKNYSVYAFPCLYPYGEGGIEATREITVAIEEHIRHGLHYWDRRFRIHPTWAFVFFSILQKRQALTATRLQMRRKDFEEATRLFSTLTQEHLAAAAEAEAKGQRVEDPKILMLRRLIHCGGAKVMGSDYSRASYRSEIWSTMLFLNPPSLWMTINPVDIHDPIVQVFAGEQIDMDAFHATAGPDSQQRAANVAKDSYATARFFNFLINLILETLFGIKSRNRTVTTTMGVLGRLRGYYGVVEAQGRGSLHVHMLLWLENAPSSERMQTMLQGEEFRRRVADYVDANVRAHLDGMTEDSIKATTREPELAWSRPPNPDSPDYQEELATQERLLVRAQQVHICKKSTCLQWKSHLGEWVCKRRAPFQTSSDTTVSADGAIVPKRTYGYLNNWNPSVLVYGSCNNDIKFISNGVEARAIIWYITAYQTKKQLNSFNWSALLAEGLAYHFTESNRVANIRERNRLLVFRCLHVLNRQMEQSGQQVMSYLLGFGDKFCSHSYTPLYWSSVAAEILRAWPNIKKSTSPLPAETTNQDSPNADDQDTNSDSASEDGITDHDQDQEENEEVVLEALPTGALIFRSQLTDYKYRGHLFADMSFVDFIANTWEDDYRPSDDTRNKVQAETKRGPAPHARAPYLEGHPRSATRQRVLRAAGHNMLPNVVGPYLPRSDDSETYQFYCASMLALLKPWRNIQELLPAGETWANTFASFLSSATPRQQDFVSGAQYYYQCRDAADHSTNEQPEITKSSASWLDGNIDESPGENGVQPIVQPGAVLPEPTEEEMLAHLETMQNPRELLHGKEAVAIARGTNLFRGNLERFWSIAGPCARIATEQDARRIIDWRETMAKDAAARQTRNDNNCAQVPVPTDSSVTPMSAPHLPTSAPSRGSVVAEPTVKDDIQPVETGHLKADQFRAFDIVKKHLLAFLAGQSPDQLLMQIQGEGGTGKSMVIHCITELFRSYRAEHKLLKGAYTGIAASLIDGNTLHTLCRLLANKDLSQTTLDELRRTWKDVEYLIIDEVSMVSRELLAQISSVLSAVKQESGQPSESRPFGGVNVIIIGDFHQFPPVASGSASALYCPNNPTKDSKEAITGRKIYEKFRTVVVLQEQCRTTDETWHTVLTHARTGTCTPEHLAVIRGLLIASDTGGSGNASVDDPAWQDAVLVTPRHGVRLAWNQMAARRYCAKTHKQLFTCPAEDKIGGRPLTVTERYNAAKKAKRGDRSARREKANLPDTVELAVGMEVMVTYNIETELDVANGARGVVQEIILDRREQIPDGLTESPREVTLAYPPECVLVKLARTKAHQLPGLEEGVIPIVPMERQYGITQADGKQKRVKRRQLPMTAAYAFTDYRSQGQTIKRVIVDIARPPSGKLTPFNAYVALSRSSGRNSIRLLRDFDDRLFTNTPSENLKVEDERLKVLNSETRRKWESGETVWIDTDGRNDVPMMDACH